MNQTTYIDVSSINYCGKEGQEIFTKDVYGIDLRNYGIRFMDGVKGKRKIYMGNVDEAWQAYTCPFTPDGGVSLAEAYIEPVAIKVNKEVCFNEFWDSYLVEQTSISLNGGIPQSFGDFYFTKLREEMVKEYQEIFWQGDTAYTGSNKQYLKVIDGIEKQLYGNSGVTKVSGATFTVDNILAQVEAVINKGIEQAALVDAPTDSYKVIMNYADVRLLQMALGKICCPNNQSIFSNYAKNGDRIEIFGYEIVPSMCSRGVILFGPTRNLVLGFDTYDSHIEYKLINMRDTTGDDAFRVIAISNIAVGIIYPELFVMMKV